jgi:Domain of unknown function (DUF4157)
MVAATQHLTWARLSVHNQVWGAANTRRCLLMVRRWMSARTKPVASGQQSSRTSHKQGSSAVTTTEVASSKGAAQAVAAGRSGAAPSGPDLLALQRVAGNGAVVRLLAERVDTSPVAGGGVTPAIAQRFRAAAEMLSGTSLEGVRVHQNSSRPAAMNALAFTRGLHIYLGPGHDEHLAHETWHAVQQAQGRVRPSRQMKYGALNDDGALEHEADVMGARISRAADANPELGRHGQRPWLSPGPENNSPPGVARPGQGVVQRVRGGLEFTEDTPATLDRYDNQPHDGHVPPAIPATSVEDIQGATVSTFVVPSPNALGKWLSADRTLLELDGTFVELTNDVSSAEWVIKRHAADVTPAVMKANLAQDITRMFSMRTQLANRVNALLAANPNSVVALAPDNVASLDLAPNPPGVFVYRPGTSKGKAQITLQYTKQDTIKRMNLLNTSKFVAGTKVAEGEDISRVTGTESAALRAADAQWSTSFSKAEGLLAALVAASNPIRDSAPPHAVVLDTDRVGLIKLMILNDALATTMTRYNRNIGEAQHKNLQRFFPKSRRDEYAKAVAGAAITPANMALLRAEILSTSTSDAGTFYNFADAGALRVDEAFAEIANANNAAALGGLIGARHNLAQGRPTSPADRNAIKTAVLGANGSRLEIWIREAARAYTDTTLHATEHVKPGGVGRVIKSTKPYTPVSGAGPGAIYEFREREISAEEPTIWNFRGGDSELKKALDNLFAASQ